MLKRRWDCRRAALWICGLSILCGMGACPKNSVYLYPQSISVEPNAEFWVAAVVPEPNGFFSYRINLAWDANYVEYVSQEYGDFDPNEPNQMAWAGAVVGSELKNSTGTMLGAPGNARNEPNLVLLRVKFRARDDVSGSVSTFISPSGQVSKPLGVNASAAFVNAAVTIE